MKTVPRSWRDYPAWLAALPRPVPAECSSPREIAAFEAESYAESRGGEAPAFRFVCEDATRAEGPFALEAYLDAPNSPARNNTRKAVFPFTR